MKIEVDPNWWTELFDDIYLQTDARSVCDPDLTRREVDLILSVLAVEPGHKILDFCGGHGRHSLELGARGFHHCSLLDYSRVLVERAKELSRQQRIPLKTFCCDARSTGLAPEQFDHVLILGNSLGYIMEPSADHHILREAHRLLRPNGWILVDITDGLAVRQHFKPNAWHEIGEDLVVCRSRELHADRVHAREMVLSKEGGLIRDRTYAIRLYDKAGLGKLLQQARFRKITVHTDFSPHARPGDYGFMNHRMIAVGRKTEKP